MSLDKEHQQQLLALAKNSIRHGLLTGSPVQINLADYPAQLRELRASFVTLSINHALRGCTGTLKAIRPLAEDVAQNAFNAAFRDPRFPALQSDEFQSLAIHLSLLTPPEPLTFTSEQDLLSQLVPGLDGLVLQEGDRHETFLPTVWRSLPRPVEFVQQLKQKAGLSPGYWSDTLKFYRYRTENIG
jgi:AmmeMemoRadiSam system protein A